MARIRTIKPEIWMSPQVMNLSHSARLLFIGLITQADDEGRGTADPRRLKAAIFGGDDDTSTSVRRWVDEITQQGLATLYEAPQHGLLYELTGWRSHQKIDKARKSGYPSPESGNCRRVSVEQSPTIRRGSEGSDLGIVPEGPERTSARDESPNGQGECQVFDAAGNGENRDAGPTATHRTHTHARAELSPEFEPFMHATFPETGHPSDHCAAIHYAMGLVGSGAITEQQLRQNLTAFRAFVDAGGYSDTSKIPTSQTWFKHDHPKRYWAHNWPAPKQLNGKQAEDPEAVSAWERLLATDGADRPPRAQAALQAIGGWSRVRERTTRDAPFIRREFIEAFAGQHQAVA